MDYEKVNKLKKDIKKDNDTQRVATNASIPEIANAQKVQGAYIQSQNTQTKSNELKPQFNNNKKVAKLSLNIFTETFNRSDITLDELRDAQVGHTWISLKYNDPTSAPTSLGNPTYDLMRRGETSMGFWPLIYRPDAFITQRRDPRYTTDQERASGCTAGMGASQDSSHSGFSFSKSVPGRVEEPDRAHSKEIKMRKEYDLTHSQVNLMLQYINQHRNKYYNLYNYNCTTFAVDAVKAAGQTAPSGSKFGICFPNAIYKELYQNSKKDNRIFVEKLQPSHHPETGRKMDERHE